MDPITGRLHLQGADWSCQDPQALQHSHVPSALCCWRGQITDQPMAGREMEITPHLERTQALWSISTFCPFALVSLLELGTLLVTLIPKWSLILSLGISKILFQSLNQPRVSPASLEPGSVLCGSFPHRDSDLHHATVCHSISGRKLMAAVHACRGEVQTSHPSLARVIVNHSWGLRTHFLKVGTSCWGLVLTGL